MMTRSDPEQQLVAQGIFPWGSAELRTYERHLTRYFSREYGDLRHDDGVECLLLNVGAGSPMSVKTDRLMKEHYDDALALFESFLDHRYMAYTMALYGDDPVSIRESEISLEQAQENKFALAAERIGLQGNERILNIGCGFGPLETWLFERFSELNVVSVTPSKVQADYCRQCLADPDHVMPASRVNLVEKTLEQLAWQDVNSKPFDLIFAVGVFEHIADLMAAFRKIHAFLKPGGRCFLHLIVSRPVFPEYMNSDHTLIGRYFPGGRIWPYDLLAQAADGLELEGQWYINGTNYWKTLDQWHRRYWEHISKLYPAVLDAAAVKYWNDYFVLCKAVLFGPMDGKIFGNGHYVFRRPR